MSVTDKIPMRIANTLLNSLKGGVVPRTGLGYITVGRKDEIDALLNDIEMISEGGASFRFVVGKYGAGKSFLLQTIRNYAMERGFVVVDADLSPERRLVGNKGDGLATYKELMKNLSTLTSPDGGALSLLLSKWVNALKTEVMTENSLTADSEKLNSLVEIKIHQIVNELESIVHGFDFARIISLYWRAVVNEDDELIEVKAANGDDHVVLVTKNAKCIVFHETEIRITGRKTLGVRGIRLSGDDVVIGMQMKTQGETLLVVSEYGMGKRTSLGEFRGTHRGNKGLACYKLTEKSGCLVGAKLVDDDREIFIITNEGILIRIEVSKISNIGRVTSGVKLMNIDRESGIKVAGIAKVRETNRDDEDEETGAAQNKE